MTKKPDMIFNEPGARRLNYTAGRQIAATLGYTDLAARTTVDRALVEHAHGNVELAVEFWKLRYADKLDDWQAIVDHAQAKAAPFVSRPAAAANPSTRRA